LVNIFVSECGSVRRKYVLLSPAVCGRLGFVACSCEWASQAAAVTLGVTRAMWESD